MVDVWGLNLGPNINFIPMKMNGSLLLTFVFKLSGVQHEADGLQTEKEIHRWGHNPENEGSNPSIGTRSSFLVMLYYIALFFET